MECCPGVGVGWSSNSGPWLALLYEEGWKNMVGTWQLS